MQDTDISLSVVMPYYKKLAELCAVLPFNARYLGRLDIELVLVLDEPSQQADVLSLLDQLPLIRARVVVNDEPHDWRTPCVALNVGIRAALGRYILVVSPESVFVGDVPKLIVKILSEHPTAAVMGRVAWGTFAEARRHGLKPLFDTAVAARGGFTFAADYYGSIAAARDLFVSVRGYDESLSEWGGDDDNLRARLSMQGALLMLAREIKLLHLSEGPPQRERWAERARPLARRDFTEMLNPPSALANPTQWGVAFGRVARDWRGIDPPSPASGHVPVVAGSASAGRLTVGTTGRGRPGRPHVVAVFSFRYDADLVEDLIANVSPVVDGWIAYDDRDSADVFSDEVARRRILLQRAHGIGARWALAIDPDERVEHGLADRIDELTRSWEPVCWSFALRELYEPDRYRIDGIWGEKTQSRLFPLRGDLFLPAQKLHGPWCTYQARPTGLNLYHLKMIDSARRKTRSALYGLLDPDRRYQAAGYEYLADETGAVLEEIPAGHEYFPAHADDHGLWMPEIAAT